MTTTNEISFDMTWNMTNPSFGQVLYGCATCYRDTVTATPNWTIDMTEATTAAFKNSYTTLNYDAATVMYKLGNPPAYSKAW